MNEKEKLEVFRNILHNGINMRFNEEILLKISQKLDEYIVEYLKRNNNKNIEREKAMKED